MSMTIKPHVSSTLDAALFLVIKFINASLVTIFFVFFLVYAQNKQKKQNGFVNIRDLNQDFLLQIPDLIESLVQIACSKDCKFKQ